MNLLVDLVFDFFFKKLITLLVKWFSFLFLSASLPNLD